MTTSASKTLTYTKDYEELLKREAEESESMSLLHHRSHIKFSKYSIYINIPVIVISAITGFLSPLALFANQDIFLGCLSIFIGLLKTIDSYFDVTKRSETHRMVSLNYIRISRWIRLQLSLEKDCRIHPNDLYDIISHDLQNIRDSEPIIPDDVVEAFNLMYKDERTAKPSITNGLTSIVINRPAEQDPDQPRTRVMVDQAVEVKMADIRTKPNVFR